MAEGTKIAGQIRSLIEPLRGCGRIVVFPEGDDPRIQQAARRLSDETLARPILIGDRQALERVAAHGGWSLAGIETIDQRCSDQCAVYAEAYRADRPKVSLGAALRLTRRPLFHAALMVKAGNAHAMVAGAVYKTPRVIEASMLTIGLAPGIRTPSSFFLMALPPNTDGTEQLLIFADCAVNVDPSSEQLADIAIASAGSAAGLLAGMPRVALMSFSTQGSNRHPSTAKIAEAVAIARKRAPELAIDGEFQADAALITRVAAMKCREPSQVAGRANVLVFPDLNAGNIAYKLVQHLAGGHAIGPILQGFAKPVSDLSRGASVEEIVMTAAITLALA